MFTDQQVVPSRLEVLLELLQTYPTGITREAVCALLQPPALNEGRTEAATSTVSAALELELATEERPKKTLRLAGDYAKSEAQEAILEAFERHVLCVSEIEPYFATFYAFLLNNPEQSLSGGEAIQPYLEQTYGARRPENIFNETKLRGLHRWFSYVGLGWYDSNGNFQPLPFGRLKRVLPKIFDGKKKLTSVDFMRRMADVCPELDGGSAFCKANPNWNGNARQCTIGLGNALLELEHDGLMRIVRPADSAGWSIANADPEVDETPDRQGAKIESFELLTLKRK